jgi:2-C-methyl-D-erythritol 4-phosphate cytidylyltransferase / 2-C-methyl-D-erythritol 2,4-cyclodiphosphate synthase
MTETKRIVALIVAAGIGSRAGGDLPKQFRLVAGEPMLRHSYAAFNIHPSIAGIFVVIGGGQEEMTKEALAGMPLPALITGGASRRDSVRNGLEAINDQGGADYVLIHDAARPFVSRRIIDALIEALATTAGAVPVLPVIDSVAYGSDIMGSTVPRENLNRIQTPQAFHFADILSAHQGWNAAEEASDDARMLMRYGGEVALVEGEEALAKLTFAEDFSTLKRQESIMIRTGSGFDVHRLVAGEELWLCGIKIEHTHGLSGHSDADVALHALTDAVLGALALGDIGDHFPPSDPQWRGASSDRFLKYAIGLVKAKGYHLSNADITIICEAPKIGPHRMAMRERMAQIMGVDIDLISVKATTTEMLGFTGRSEGIAAQAVVSFIHRKTGYNE